MNTQELLEQFRGELLRTGKSQKTAKDYVYNVGRFIDWLEDTDGTPFDIPVTEFSIREYSGYLSRKSPVSTVNARLSAIQSFCNYLHSVHGCPVIKVDKKKGTPEPKVEVLNKQELFRYRQYVAKNCNLLHRAIIETLLYTGIREEELCDLSEDDVILTPKNAHLVIRSGKGDKYRTVKIKDECKALLIEYREHRPVSDTGRFFIGNRGTLTPNGVYKMVHRHGKAIGLDVYPHKLRHQCFTAQARNAHTPEEVKAISQNAGHSSTDLTYKYYINASKETRDRLVDDMDFYN